MSRFYFPISEPMVGSVIPGKLMRYQVVKIVNYPDHTDALKRRRVAVEDPVKKFPDMNQPHGEGNPLLEKLKAMLSGGQSGPEMRQGYTPFVGTRNWRKS